MIFTRVLGDAFVIEIDPQHDERGFFARTFCADEFRRINLSPTITQCSISYNARRGTLRGMHFQVAPHEEDKLVRCTSGAIYDVIVDIRPGSGAYGHWFGVELLASVRNALFVPKGFAHGFLTLMDDTEVFYQISTPFATGFGRGCSWNDPAVGIVWPFEPVVISERDAAYPHLRDVIPR